MRRRGIALMAISSLIGHSRTRGIRIIRIYRGIGGEMGICSPLRISGSWRKNSGANTKILSNRKKPYLNFEENKRKKEMRSRMIWMPT